MPDQEGYEVIRFVQHGSECQPVMDYARGEIFIQWLRSHPVVRKEEMFYMMRELLKQLVRFHQSKEEHSYPYVTPYSVFLSENREVLLLDFGAKSNEGIARQLKRRSIRNNFFPRMQGVRDEAEIKSEIYSLGRTMQFLLTVQEPEPPMNKLEELRLRRIIARCLGNSRERPYEHIEEILKQFPKYKKINPKLPQILKKFTISSGVLFLVLVSAAGLALKKIVPAMHETKKSADVQAADIKKIRKDSNAKVQETVSSEETQYNALCMDMGLLYFAELEDYEKSREYFQRAGDSGAAAVYSRLAGYMNVPELEDGELSMLLADAEAGLDACTDVRFVQCILRVYEKMEEVKGELTGEQYTTVALLGEKARTIEGFGEIGPEKRERICLKLAGIYEKEGKMKEAQEVCAEEIRQNETSKKLRLLYMKLQCQDPRIERSVCASTIKEFLDQIPELAAEDEFLKIQEEYGIKIEAGSVSFEG